MQIKKSYDSFDYHDYRLPKYMQYAYYIYITKCSYKDAARYFGITYDGLLNSLSSVKKVDAKLLKTVRQIGRVRNIKNSRV